jgi:hypothetical protein
MQHLIVILIIAIIVIIQLSYFANTNRKIKNFLWIFPAENDEYKLEKEALIEKINSAKDDDLKKMLATAGLNMKDYQKNEQQKVSEQTQQKSLYADAIIDGKFNRVRETPNEDSIFELKLNHAGDTRATVVVYKPAYKRVIVHPSFLNGCENQILGMSNVKMQKEGVAVKDENGNWCIKAKPQVKIS